VSCVRHPPALGTITVWAIDDILLVMRGQGSKGGGVAAVSRLEPLVLRLLKIMSVKAANPSQVESF
jgi:hypothetical protein